MTKKEKKFDLNFDLAHSMNLALIVSVLATSIGAFGEFPPAPKVVKDFFENNPNARWILVYILIHQGNADANELEALLGTGVTYLIWTYLNSLDNPNPTPNPTP
jgi:hypothetical protein